MIRQRDPVGLAADAARAWLDVERANLVAAALFAANHGKPGYTTDLSLLLHYYLDTAGYFREAETLHLAAVHCAVGDAVRGRSYNSLGCIYWRIGRFADGRDCYLRALELARAIGDRLAEGRSLTNVALSYFRLGQYSEAIECYGRALAIFEVLGLPERVSVTLGGLGWAELRLGRRTSALRHFQRSLDSARAVGDGICEEAHALSNVAAAYEQLGRAVEARHHYERALELSQRLDFPVGTSDALNGLGRLHLAEGRIELALQFHRDALGLSEEIGNRPFAVEISNDYGVALCRAERLGEASERHQIALDEATALDDRFELARASTGLATVLAAQSGLRTSADNLG